MRTPLAAILLWAAGLVGPACAQTEFMAESNPLSKGGYYLDLFYHEPTGQEFIATMARLDYVKLRIWMHDSFRARPCWVTIREETIDGSIVAVSEPVWLTYGGREVRFTFSSAVTLNPGGLYVLEVNPDKSPPKYAMRVLYTEWPTYLWGRLIYGIGPAPNADLLFELGVFMPDIVSTNAERISYVEQEPAVLVAPTAVFTNDYITNFHGATLTVSNLDWNVPTDSLSVSGSVGAVVVDGRVVGTLTGGSNRTPLRVTFWEPATAADVQEVMRRLSFENQSETNWMWAGRAFRATFATKQGTVSFRFDVDLTEIYDAPVASLMVRDVVAFMGYAAAIVPHKKVNYVTLDASGSTDVDSPIDFDWYIGNLAVDTTDWRGLLSVPLPSGHYDVAVRATDYYSESFADASFDVMTAGEATRLLIPLIRYSEIANRAKLVTLLRRARLAFDTRRYERGVKALRSFEALLLEANGGEPHDSVSPAVATLIEVMERFVPAGG